MKIKTTCELKFDHAYTGYRALTFNDSDQNEVCVEMTDDQYLALAETLNGKANRIRKERAEEAAEAARAEAAKLEGENEDE